MKSFAILFFFSITTDTTEGSTAEFSMTTGLHPVEFYSSKLIDRKTQINCRWTKPEESIYSLPLVNDLPIPFMFSMPQVSLSHKTKNRAKPNTYNPC